MPTSPEQRGRRVVGIPLCHVPRGATTLVRLGLILISHWLVAGAASAALAHEPADGAKPAPLTAASLETQIVVENVCAWPNLTKLPDGSMAAVIFNQPSHGSLPGDVECWVSRDGRQWERRGKPAVHEPDTNRMNVAAGLARNGDLLVLCSGWSNQQQPGQEKKAPFRDKILRSWVCRSDDGGRTWSVTREFPEPPAGLTEFIPFGDIQTAADGSLRTCCYAAELRTLRNHRCWMLRSDDDGRTWQVHSQISDRHNETTILPLGENRWLAAARGRQTDLFRSDDDGRTWEGPTPVTQTNQINGHLLRLKDGAILLSLGDRIKDQFGVQAMLSRDEGRTWTAPLRLASTASWDCGYPSSVELDDGSIVTAYYAAGGEGQPRYFLGVVLWKPER